MTQSTSKNILSIISKHLCLSCGACFAVCKPQAISFTETTGGYVFPQISTDKCTHCGLCYDVCPGHHLKRNVQSKITADPMIGQILSCHIGSSTHEKIYNNAQSGGVATALLSYLFETNQIKAAIVTVMKKSCPPRAEAILATCLPDLLNSQKSKYTPIPLLSIIPQLKHIQGPIAIIGLPCHIHGLMNIFELYPKLRSKIVYKFGLICDRILTCAAIDFLSHKASSRQAINFIFRDKNRPNYPGNTVVTTVDNEQIVLGSSLRMSIKDFFTPTRCRLCFDKLNIFSDIVLGDPHNIPRTNKPSNGETLIFCRTQQGLNLIEMIHREKKITIRSENVQVAIKGQQINRKRADWCRYMNAWESMGKPYIQTGISINTVDTAYRKKKYINDLKHSIALDTFKTRKDLIAHAKRWLLKNRLLKKLHRIYNRSLKLISQKPGEKYDNHRD